MGTRLVILFICIAFLACHVAYGDCGARANTLTTTNTTNNTEVDNSKIVSEHRRRFSLRTTTFEPKDAYIDEVMVTASSAVVVAFALIVGNIVFWIGRIRYGVFGSVEAKRGFTRRQQRWPRLLTFVSLAFMVVLAAAALQYSYTLGENITRFFNTVSGVIVEINDVIANVAVRLLRIDFAAMGIDDDASLKMRDDAVKSLVQVGNFVKDQALNAQDIVSAVIQYQLLALILGYNIALLSGVLVANGSFFRVERVVLGGSLAFILAFPLVGISNSIHLFSALIVDDFCYTLPDFLNGARVEFFVHCLDNNEITASMNLTLDRLNATLLYYKQQLDYYGIMAEKLFDDSIGGLPSEDSTTDTWNQFSDSLNIDPAIDNWVSNATADAYAARKVIADRIKAIRATMDELIDIFVDLMELVKCENIRRVMKLLYYLLCTEMVDALVGLFVMESVLIVFAVVMCVLGVVLYKRVNNPRKQYYCAICDRYFRFGGWLRIHNRLHAKDKYYKTEFKRVFNMFGVRRGSWLGDTILFYKVAKSLMLAEGVLLLSFESGAYNKILGGILIVLSMGGLIASMRHRPLSGWGSRKSDPKPMTPKRALDTEFVRFVLETAEKERKLRKKNDVSDELSSIKDSRRSSIIVISGPGRPQLTPASYTRTPQTVDNHHVLPDSTVVNHHHTPSDHTATLPPRGHVRTISDVGGVHVARINGHTRTASDATGMQLQLQPGHHRTLSDLKPKPLVMKRPPPLEIPENSISEPIATPGVKHNHRRTLTEDEMKEMLAAASASYNIMQPRVFASPLSESTGVSVVPAIPDGDYESKPTLAPRKQLEVVTRHDALKTVQDRQLMTVKKRKVLMLLVSAVEMILLVNLVIVMISVGIELYYCKSSGVGIDMTPMPTFNTTGIKTREIPEEEAGADAYNEAGRKVCTLAEHAQLYRYFVLITLSVILLLFTIVCGVIYAYMLESLERRMASLERIDIMLRTHDMAVNSPAHVGDLPAELEMTNMV